MIIEKKDIKKMEEKDRIKNEKALNFYNLASTVSFFISLFFILFSLSIFFLEKMS
jgi:hypothetical protein